jgi:hypothetical protein
MQGTNRVSVQSAALCRVACVHTDLLTTGCAYRSMQAFSKMCATHAVAHKLRDRVEGDFMQASTDACYSEKLFCKVIRNNHSTLYCSVNESHSACEHCT